MDPIRNAFPEKNRDLAVGSARLQEVQKAVHYYVDNHHCDVIGRVFHGMPGREARVSFSPTRRDARLDAEGPRDVLHFGSYNYSGLNGHPRVVAAAEAALRRYGTTVSGVRLLNGTCELHLDLERALAEFLGFEDCVTYSSGYAANLSVLSALCGEGDVVLSDMLNHQSIIDGLKLSGADIRTYRHKSLRSIEATLKKLPREQRKFIITDGVFSMDGDVADLPGIAALAERYNAFVLVDDAHATAAMGPNGRGTPAFFGLQSQVDVLTGSLSKGLPGIGGFAAGSKATIDLLRFGSNGYIFSASLPPPIAAGLLEGIRILQEQPELQERLHHNENYLRAGIRAMGLDCMNSESPIIPILMPAYEKTFELTRLLHLEGIYVNPVGYPAVSKNRTRLRINVSANLIQADLDRFLDALERCSRKLNLLDAPPLQQTGT
ncbi:aminotransferase class I/II-fold pyridoxal phosphate-dependent enzyme [Myxococcus sp. AM001]|nr:aminotransferase class I/II-fold pyridoxal phosphate-dependent enzyme [Myxococcus sp. AM001]